MGLRKVSKFPSAIWFRVAGSGFRVKNPQPETLKPKPRMLFKIINMYG
jgi:hypothetical protein